MKNFSRWLVLVQFLAAVVVLQHGAHAAHPKLRHKGPAPDFTEVLDRLNDSAKRLRTLSANLEYTTVTVIVNDKSTEYGEIYYRKGKEKMPDVLIHFTKPEEKVVSLRKDTAQVYLRKTNQIQEYDVGKRSELVQQFLLLGFGTEVSDLKKAYDLRYKGEEEILDDTTAILELTPLNKAVAGQLTKVELWISEDSWLPIQQKFFEPGGDYLLARYSNAKVNRDIPSSQFEIKADPSAKRVKMN